MPLRRQIVTGIRHWIRVVASTTVAASTRVEAIFCGGARRAPHRPTMDGTAASVARLDRPALLRQIASLKVFFNTDVIAVYR
jgi:hypothetical protein